MAALLLAGVAAWLAWRLGGLDIRATTADARAYAALRPIGAAAAYVLVHVLVAAFAVPAVWAMSVAGGALFGPWLGLPLAIASSAAGATIAMLTVRSALRDRVAARFPHLAERFDGAANGRSAALLFAARVTPVLPFALISAARACAARLPPRGRRSAALFGPH